MYTRDIRVTGCIMINRYRVYTLIIYMISVYSCMYNRYIACSCIDTKCIGYIDI